VGGNRRRTGRVYPPEQKQDPVPFSSVVFAPVPVLKIGRNLPFFLATEGGWPLSYY
jgi:hypothetical protein